MGRSERLKLLFAGDEALLQVDTQRNIAPVVGDGDREKDKDKPTLSEKIPNETVTHVAESDSNQSGGPLETVNQQQGKWETDPVLHPEQLPVENAFSPLLAVSRFPYKYIRGDLSQAVAKKFFDGGKFWTRGWDLYYIHVPPSVGYRPLLLVPTSQAERFLTEINEALECDLSMSKDGRLGLVLVFSNNNAPKPTYLGKSTNKQTKDELEQSIPESVEVYSQDGYPVDCEKDQRALFDDFCKMIEAGVDATKNKKASKARKQEFRLQFQHGWARCLRRTQCYFGLRPRCSRDELGAHHSSNEPLPPLNVRELVTLPFWNEPIFISIDVESNEFCHSQITEIGISILDTLDLVDKAPGGNAQNWVSQIRSRHFRTKEYAGVVNMRFVNGCPDKFQFGESEWVSLADLPTVVDSCFQPPYSSRPDSHKLTERNLICVGHNTTSDITYLRNLGTRTFKNDPPTPGDGERRFLDCLDTAELFRTLRNEPQSRSLAHILSELGMVPWHLHNAGNDARYTMEALVQMIVQSAVFPAEDRSGECMGGVVLVDGEGVTLQERPLCADDIDGGEPGGLRGKPVV
ncbi:hypothetical protein ASPZODRAFT_447596 [Penicilliopsis zonata CBS 506.65]|uniref:Gfd2/YDR514C-like C-terminal domain-containing protein n=1 Tax=Penicilliopsis zonata CBS 506.65 TaxID=1073090 RepID=A0A1L9SWW0_9EURO|nr:hypothetical protein ASPZODRAFT_447596 [Penicilliopsis zonata CBS 506.65]OJJ51670.1 hypothetical protein ASPZODRAFT_447596 [Penicilliopsis zonata CBS 506.65]